MNQEQSPSWERTDGSADEAAEVRVGWKMAGLGMQMAAEVMAGMLLGWLWDQWQGGTNGIKIGAVIGIAIGLWSLIKGSLSLNKQLEARHPTSGRGQPIPSPDDDHGNYADDNADDRDPRRPAQG
jgi:F0F1-type ATP synthase assembly protein I